MTDFELVDRKTFGRHSAREDERTGGLEDLASRQKDASTLGRWTCEHAHAIVTIKLHIHHPLPLSLLHAWEQLHARAQPCHIPTRTLTR